MTVPSTDLAHPKLPLAVTVANVATAPVSKRLLPLDAGSLVGAACSGTGLEDFGEARFREPLHILCRALEEEARLHTLGRFGVRRMTVGLLQARLRATELWRTHPEILRTPLTAPIVVLGLPRTGTTLLLWLMSQDPGLRCLPYWEGLAPIPGPGPDRRRKTASQSLRILDRLAPQFVAMHEMAVEAPEEEILLLAIDFASQLFETAYRVPSYAEWFQAADLTGSYHYLVKLLQTLQWLRRGDRWLLKSPQHLAQLGPLLSAMPDAVVIQTHRDPVTVTASLIDMVTYGRRINSTAIDPAEIAEFWTGRLDWMLRRSITDRPGGRDFCDVHFAELQSDPMAVVRRIYAAASRDLTPDVELRMRRFLAANPKGRHGTHTYRLDDFGLDAAALRERFAFYQDRFDIPDDPPPLR